MRKISAILLVILCVLALSSCASVGYEKAPSWLRGKTWTGFKTYLYEDGSFTQDFSFTFNNDGTFYVEDYLLEFPEGMVITTSGDSNTYQISFVGPFEYEGVVYNIDSINTFTKISDNECEYNSIFKSSADPVPTLTSVILNAN